MIPVFDGHNDTLLSYLENPERDFFERRDDGHIDFVRAHEGGLAGGFFAVFPSAPELPGLEGHYLKRDGSRVVTPPPSLDRVKATEKTNAMVSLLLRWAADERGRFRLVKTAAELERAIADGVFCGILHFEGAEAIDADLAALDVYHAAGLRSLGIVWSRSNLFGHGVPFAYPSSPDVAPGLTSHGVRLVRRCNELKIMIDLSHLSERGFWDVAELSSAPLVATHSNAHALCASSRNLTDEQLAAIKRTGGVVGLNFNVSFLARDGSRDKDLPLAVMVEHVDHLVDALGLDGVALGSDFDGATMPNELSDASKLQNLVAALAAAGYSDLDLRKIANGNWLRVLRETWGA